MDPYRVLGVDKSASMRDIKRAYRRLSKKYHPDLCDDSTFSQKFEEVNTAYTALLTLRSNSKSSSSTEKAAFSQSTSFSSGYRRRTGESLQYTLHISLYEACFGGKQDISYIRTDSCGKKQREEVSVEIPPGSCSGDIFRVQGKGNGSKYGGNPGDLFITVEVMPDSTFYLNGSDLETIAVINIAQALIGGKKTIDLLDRDCEGNAEKLKINIPAGSSAGTKIKIPSKGFVRKNGQRGDLYVLLDIEIPNMTDSRSVVEEFASAAGMMLED